MGCSHYNYRQPDPCANCGKRGGVMSDSSWGHNHLCCSHACGKRLRHKIENGMGGPHPNSYGGLNLWDTGWPSSEDRLLNLRIRIKQLRHRVRASQIPTQEGRG
ncbi:hypothetical protein [Lysobacter olei]